MLIVFQCANCRCIVGDSTEWLKAIPSLDLILLGQPAPGAVDVAAPTSRAKAVDNQTATRDLTCSVCKRHIGYLYDRKQGEDREVEGAYALILPMLLSYKVNSPRTDPEPEPLESQTRIQTESSEQIESISEKLTTTGENQVNDLEKRVGDLESLVMYLFSKVGTP